MINPALISLKKKEQNQLRLKAPAKKKRRKEKKKEWKRATASAFSNSSRFSTMRRPRRRSSPPRHTALCPSFTISPPSLCTYMATTIQNLCDTMSVIKLQGVHARGSSGWNATPVVYFRLSFLLTSLARPCRNILS